jgi:integrase
VSHKATNGEGVTSDKISGNSTHHCITRLSHSSRPPGLWRRGAIYQYRVRVPANLVQGLRRTHINRSLATASRSEALRKIKRIAYEIEETFERALLGEATMLPPSRLHVPPTPALNDIGLAPAPITLGQAIDAFMADPTRPRAPKSEVVYRSTYTAIAEVIGSKVCLPSVSRETCRELLAILLRLPANAKKRFPHLSLREAANFAHANSIAPMSVSNANEYMTKLAVLLNWAVKEEMIARNPASGLRVTIPAGKRDRRRPFTTAQLIKIFNAPLYTGCKDDASGYALVGEARPRRSRFWIPLIGLYSGMRLNEICQLNTADLKKIGVIWCFDVHTEAEDGKSLKTITSRRIVPLHPLLIGAGILAYHRERIKMEDAKLFPDILLDSFGMHSGRVSKWFARFLIKCGAAEPQTCYHSFRHCFRDALREARVEREVALRLGGWADSGAGANAVGDGYGSGFSVERLYEAVSGIQYPGVNWGHIEKRSTLDAKNSP